jgi:hypothetical protein
VRVQAFQVTMKSPEGACKKFELEAGKDLLEVSSCCSLIPVTILGSEFAVPAATSGLAHRDCTVAAVQPVCLLQTCPLLNQAGRHSAVACC